MRQILNQLRSAFITLTRLPYIKIANDDFDLKNSLWAFPIVGIILFIIAYPMMLIFIWLGIPSAVSSITICFIIIILTGSLHEDGLADCADGLGGHDKTRRLEIMRDSHIGTYGTLALVFSIDIRIAAVYFLWLEGYLFTALIISLMASRGAMVFIPFFCKPARDNGLAAIFTNLDWRQLVIGQAIIFIIGLVLIGYNIVMVMLFCVATAYLIAKFSTHKFGGFTGDILGATEQIVQIICLLIFLSIY